MKTTWLAMLITFVDAHFKTLLGAIAGQSGIIAVVYGLATDDLLFAIAFAAIFALVCAGTVKLFKGLDANASFTEGAMASKID